MKKLFLLCVIVLGAITMSYAEQQDTTKITQKEVYNDIKGIVKSLAENLAVGTEYVWKVLVKQSVVNAIVYLIAFALGIIALLIAYKLLINTDWSYSADETEVVKGVFGIALAVLGMIVVIVSIVNLDVIVTGFVNPEYAAIKTVLDALK